MGQVGDRVICSECSLWNDCGYFREGQVCTVPGSEGKRLSDLLRTKDPEQIKEAMASIVAEQADMVEDRLKDHKAGNDDENLMKDMTALFKNSESLHKLIAPRQNGPLVQIGMINGPTSQAVVAGDPRQIASLVYRELEEQNPGAIITDDMVRERISQYQQKAIEAQVVDP